MNKFLVIHLVFFIFSIALFALSSYMSFDEMSRWYSGAFPEALRFIVLVSIPFPLSVVFSRVFVQLFHIEGKWWRFAILGVNASVAITWLGIESLGLLLAGWDSRVPTQELIVLSSLFAIAAAVVSIVFGLLAVRRQFK